MIPIAAVILSGRDRATGEEAGLYDNTTSYQNDFLNENITNLYSTSYRPTDADVWINASDITGSDVSSDIVTNVPNSGTGSDYTQATSGARSRYISSFSRYLEPVVPGSTALTDSWWRYPLKGIRIDTGKRIDMTPVTANPTYLEGYLVVNVATDNAVIWSHRSESTRLIQIAVSSGKFVFQLRSSGNTLRTLTSTVDALTGRTAIIYFKFNKAGNSHALSVNGETEVTNTWAFGSETFNATLCTFGAYSTDGSTYTQGALGNYHEAIIRTSAFPGSDKANCLTYLRMKYLEFKLASAPAYTAKSNVVLLNVGDDLKTILEAAEADTHYRLATGEHIVTDQINITQSNINIEIPTGTTVFLDDNSHPEYYVDLVTNQNDANPITDATAHGTFTGSTATHIWVVIDGTGSPNTFKWAVGPSDGFPPVSYPNTGIPCSTSPTLLQDGISISFASVTGHLLNAGCLIAIGGKFGIFQIGTGFQTDYIENVKIFGYGTLDANEANQAKPSVHSINSAFVVKFWGRTRNCGIYGIECNNSHRVLMAYGDHNGTYLTGGGTTGGTSFDQEFTDIIACSTTNIATGDAGIELGHPMHRGVMRYIRCNSNTLYAFQVPIELNFKMIYYSCRANRVRTNPTYTLIHNWRRSDNGIVINNRQFISTNNPMVATSAPSGWETAVNILKYDNINE